MNERKPRVWLTEIFANIFRHYAKAFEHFDPAFQLYLDLRMPTGKSARMPDIEEIFVFILSSLVHLVSQSHDRKVLALDRCEPRGQISFSIHPDATKQGVERLNRIKEDMARGFRPDWPRLFCDVMVYLYIRSEMVATSLELADMNASCDSKDYFDFLGAFRDFESFCRGLGAKRLTTVPKNDQAEAVQQMEAFWREALNAKATLSTFLRTLSEVPQDAVEDWSTFRADLENGLLPLQNSIELGIGLMDGTTRFLKNEA